MSVVKTSQGFLTTLVVVAGVVAAFVGVAPLAFADEAVFPGTTTGASESVDSASVDSGVVDSASVDSASVDGGVVDGSASVVEGVGSVGEVVAPAGVNVTSVGGSSGGVSANGIDTSDMEVVRQAFIDRYMASDVQLAPSRGVDLKGCVAGEVNPQSADLVVGAWNFMRGLNNLDAVRVDPGSALSSYMQKAALSQAAQNAYGKSRGLSHYPMRDGFECGDRGAQAGASHANLAQANAFSAAEQVLWWYQDWSGYGVSTMSSDGFNDRLGHRNWLMDPYVRESGYGNVNGYNALAVATGGNFDDYEASRMKNPNAVAPETMAWPSQGYFPSELLTSTTADDVDGDDVERWSFHVKGGDMSSAQVSVTGPQGRVPVRVVNSGKNAPRHMYGYGAVLFKMPNTHIHAPKGHGVNTYTVRVSGVKGTSQSQYYYQVKVFNAKATHSAPTLTLAREPIAIEGATTAPAHINATGSNNIYQWQISADEGRTWKDAKVDSRLRTQGLSQQPNTLSWAPTLKLCQNGKDYYPCPLTKSQADTYRFRLRATNAYGTTYTKPIKAHYIGFTHTPSTITRGTTLNAKLTTTGNNDYLAVSQDTHYYAGSTYLGKNTINTNITAPTITAKVTVTVWTYHTSYRFHATKNITLR